MPLSESELKSSYEQLALSDVNLEQFLYLALLLAAAAALLETVAFKILRGSVVAHSTLSVICKSAFIAAYEKGQVLTPADLPIVKDHLDIASVYWIMHTIFNSLDKVVDLQKQYGLPDRTLSWAIAAFMIPNFAAIKAATGLDKKVFNWAKKMRQQYIPNFETVDFGAISFGDESNSSNDIV